MGFESRLTTEARAARGPTLSDSMVSPAARRADDALHVAEVALQRLSARRRQAVLGLRRAPVEVLVADDVLRLFELARVHAQVAVRGVQELFEVVKGERFVDGEGADDGEADSFMYQSIKLGGGGRPVGRLVAPRLLLLA